MGSTCSGGTKQVDCPHADHARPLVGIVTSKERRSRDCFVLTVKRDNPIEEITTAVTKYQYDHAVLNGRIWLTAGS